MVQPGRRSGATLSRLLAVVTATSGAWPELTAQCPPTMISSGGYPGLDSYALGACAWSPSGTGATAEWIVAAGLFDQAGTINGRGIAAFNTATAEWRHFGSGVPLGQRVQSVVALPNGDLVAAGGFTQISGVAANGIARFDGQSWLPLGSGLSNGPYLLDVKLAVLANGDIVAAGEFTSAGSIAVNNIARWNGSTWSSMGPGFSYVRDLAVAPNGNLLVAHQGGLSVYSTSWSTSLSGAVDAVTAMPNGDLFAFGSTPTALWRRTGSTWTQFATFATGTVFDLASDNAGRLFVAGSFTQANGLPANGVATWNGSVWSSLASGLGGLPSGFNIGRAIVPMPNGRVAVAGQFASAGTVSSQNLALWDGTVWGSMGGGADDLVESLHLMRNGDLLVGGSFSSLGVYSPCVARRSGAVWTSLGSGLSGTTVGGIPRVRDLADLVNGDAVAVGSFTHAGGVLVRGVARWNGTSWSSLGSGLTGPYAFGAAAVVMPNGDLIVGGGFTAAGGVPAQNIARWNGTTWSAIGSGTTNLVDALVVLADGSLVASFENYGLMRWTGSAWATIGTIAAGASIDDLCATPDGGLVVGGWFTAIQGVPANHVARWNGSSWAALGSGLPWAVSSLRVLPDGDVLAATAPRYADLWRWNGAAWTIEPAVQANPFDGPVRALESMPNGDLVIGGNFTAFGSTPSSRLAYLLPTCRAQANTLASACVRPAGTLDLTAKSLPWIGATALTQASPFAPSTLGIVATGFGSTQVPLSILDPSAGTSCDLLVTPDFLALIAPVGNVGSALLAVPPDPAIVGGHLWQQMVEIQFGPSGLIGVYGSNALELVVGSL